jgi:hypothetical protein
LVRTILFVYFLLLLTACEWERQDGRRSVLSR